jgi:uncharacterized protein YggE
MSHRLFGQFSYLIIIATIVFYGRFGWAEVALISVVGRAEKVVDPNEVNVGFEIWSKASQAKMAQEAVSKEYQRIKILVEKFKIKKEDLQTTSYSLNPEYDYIDGKSRLKGYRTSHFIFITIRNVEETGAFLDALVSPGKSEGSVNIQSVSWGYDKKDQVENTLLNAAVKNARLQAEELSKASGAKIKGIYRLSRVPSGETSFEPVIRSSKMMISEASSSVPTEFSSGAIKIGVQVRADYEIQ